jgi:hypothetical protein
VPRFWSATRRTFTPPFTGVRSNKLEQKISHLESRLTHKDEVIAEIMESHVRLKKSLGED